MRRLATSALLAAGVVLTLPSTAEADPTDLLGLDARSRAMGMATVALCQGWSAGTCNPAGAAMAPKIAIGFGYSLTFVDTKVNGIGNQLLDIRGVPFGFVKPLSVGKGIRLAVGVSGYLPDQFVGRVLLVPAYEPRFILLDNRPHRLVINPVFAIRYKWISLGLGVTVWADAAGNGITFNVGVKGGQKIGETEIDVSLPPKVAPLVGLQVRPLKWLKFGIFYRGQIDLRMALDILANVDVAGIVTGDALITLRAVNHFTPHKVDIGVAVEPTKNLTIAAGVVYYHWSNFRGGLPDLRILVDLGLNPPLVQAFFPPDNFKNTVAPRFGAEYEHRWKKGFALAGRIGYVFEPSPVPAQVGLPGLIDNPRHAITFGLGFRVDKPAKWYPFPVTVDASVQYHILAERRTARNLIADPSLGGLISRGSLISMSLSFTLQY